MNGREERNAKIEENIKSLLANAPDYIKAYDTHIFPLARDTRRTYLRIVIAFIEYVNKNLEDITIEDVERYLARDIKDGKRMSSAHRETSWSALNSFFRYMYNTGRVKNNPVKDVIRRVKSDGEEGVRTDYLNKREIRTYFRALDRGVGSSKAKSFQRHWKERDVAIVKMFLLTGMRCSALVGINIQDIDFEKKIVSTITKGGKYNVYDISGFFDVIEAWLKKRKELLGDVKCDALFISNRLQRMSVASVENLIKKYAININGKNITPHKLRATFGTMLYQKTKDIYFVSQALGHKNIETTKIYIRGQRDVSASASSMMLDIIKNKKNKEEE